MKKPYAIHPLLVAAFPVLFLFANNMHQFTPGMVVVPVAVVVALAVLAWAALTLVFRDVRRAALLCSLGLLLFFSFDSDLPISVEASTYDRRPLGALIKYNRVTRFLKQRGYKTVCFESGYSFTELKDSDVYVASGSLSLFQNAVMDLTPIPLAMKVVCPGGVFHESRVLHPFEHLADSRGLDEPVFVFAHIVCPHPPFVFDRHGKARPLDSFGMQDGSMLMKPGGYTRERYVEHYRDQVIFINKKLKAAVEELLSDPSDAPVIIVQADHGPGSRVHWENPELTDFRERLSILSAYYFPGGTYESLYGSITPVNTFRVVFNSFFGGEYDLLEDRSYFSTWARPYAYIEYENVQ